MALRRPWAAPSRAVSPPPIRSRPSAALGGPAGRAWAARAGPARRSSALEGRAIRSGPPGPRPSKIGPRWAVSRGHQVQALGGPAPR